MRPKRILVSEGSSLSARQTIMALGLAGYSIDLCDVNLLCLGRFSRFVRRGFESPALGADPAGYLRFVVDRLKRGGYDVLLPVHEQAFLFSRARYSLSRLAGLAVPEFGCFCRVQNKASFALLLEELAIPHPATRVVGTEEELVVATRFPFFIKTEYGTASTGVWRIDRPEDLTAAIALLRTRGLLNGNNRLLVQDGIAGTVERVQAIFDAGRLVAWHGYKQRAAGPGGGDLAKASVLRPSVPDHVARLGRHLNWHGAISFDYIFDEVEQTPWFIDCNPRLVEPMNAHFAAVNLADILVKVSLGEHVEPCAPGQEGVRSHMTLMALLAATEERGARRAILRRLAQALLGRGEFRDSREELTPVCLDPLGVIPLAAVAARLLVNPRSAAAISARTVKSYALSLEAASAIADLGQSLPEAGEA
jgi:predicted ATP-grasp superfamily ATP-dependent carboligase